MSSENLYDGKKGIFELDSTHLSRNDKNEIVCLHEKFLNKAYMLLFYAPWCGHCKNMVNQISQLGEQLYDENFIIATFNCEKQKDIPNKYNIEGFPTIYLSVAGKTELYTGERTIPGFLEHLCTNLEKCIGERKVSL